MTLKKQVVLLTGASGSMGFEAFKILWNKREKYALRLLLRPSKKNRKKFRKYEKQALQEGGLKIVWGDVLNREDVNTACRGIDWCLHPLALISPGADRNPEMAHKVNARGTRYIVEAIEAQDPAQIKLVYIGSIAEYGDLLPPVHTGRCGDPILPSKYDHYALSKIRGELAVMQSNIRHRVSLRQTFILIPELLSLRDPIMFHQPPFRVSVKYPCQDGRNNKTSTQQNNDHLQGPVGQTQGRGHNGNQFQGNKSCSRINRDDTTYFSALKLCQETGQSVALLRIVWHKESTEGQILLAIYHLQD